VKSEELLAGFSVEATGVDDEFEDGIVTFDVCVGRIEVSSMSSKDKS
jgi:hypothetical protein